MSGIKIGIKMLSSGINKGLFAPILLALVLFLSSYLMRWELFSYPKNLDFMGFYSISICYHSLIGIYLISPQNGNLAH